MQLFVGDAGALSKLAKGGSATELMLSESDRGFAVERLLTWVRCYAVVFYAAASTAAPGDDVFLTVVIGLILAVGALFGVLVNRTERANAGRIALAFTAFDAIIVSAVLANNTADPDDVITIIAFVIIYEGALRWGRRGGVILGFLMAAVVGVWTAVTFHRAGIPISAESIVLRGGIMILIGFGFGSTVLQLQRQRGVMQQALDASHDATLSVDAEGIVASANDACETVLGIGPGELIGTCLSSVFEPVDDRLPERYDVEMTFEARPCEQSHRLVEVQITPVPGIEASFVVCRDITERAARTRLLDHAATHDELTGLPNRRMLMKEMHHHLSKASDSGMAWALLIDLDDFKRVNDSMGHQAGDQLLKITSQRLSNLGGDDALVARLGGDEFAICLTGPNAEAQVDELAQALVSKLAEEVHLPAGSAQVSASIGVGCGVPGLTTVDELVHRADVAGYAAKAQGKQCVMHYRQGMEDLFLDGKALAADLRAAIRSGAGISVVYQPIVSLERDFEIVAAEALCRWLHPTRGHLRPDEFIPAAESLGLMESLGRVVRRRAMADLHHNASRRRLGLSVNVSGSELANRDFVEHLVEDAAEVGFPLDRLIVELTEAVDIEQSSSVLKTLTRVRELGCRLAIDDFGTGHASLASLRWLPIDYLKLDRSFVQDASDGDAGALALVDTVCDLARRFGFQVVAEGIETDAHLSVVAAVNCQFAQGYLFGRPESLAGLNQTLTQRVTTHR